MRETVCGIFLASAVCLALPGVSIAQPMPEAARAAFNTRQIGTHGILLQASDGGNAYAEIGTDGLVLVDDQYATLDAKLVDALSRILPPQLAVRYVINTHYHWDHSGGNLRLASAGATIVAHDAVRLRLADGATGGTGGVSSFTMPPAAPAALPVITYQSELTLYVNGGTVRLEHEPRAHTDGDTVVFLDGGHVVHMGDIYVRYGFPYIDVKAGGTIAGTIRACEHVLAQVPADAVIIPGHGDLASVADLRAYLDMLRGAAHAVAQATTQGKSVRQMQQARILAQWHAEYGHGFVSTDEFIESLHYSLARSAKK